MRFFLGVVLALATGLAHAYVGPGLGVGVLGAIIGLLTAILLAVIGTVWYPIKRMLRMRSGSRSKGDAEIGSEGKAAPGPGNGQKSRS